MATLSYVFLRSFGCASANSALEYYNSLSYVQWAETDGIMEGQSLSYGNDMMGSDEAKEYIVNNNISTNEVNVAVIDGGINFNKKDFINSGRVIDSGFNSSNMGLENSAQQDSGNYHGSDITSIILDNTTENVNVIGYKVLNSEGKGTNLAVASGIEKAADDDVDVINLSLSGEGSSQLIVDAVNEAVSSGIVVVCAAGNEADDVMNYCPANIESIGDYGLSTNLSEIDLPYLKYAGNSAFCENMYLDKVYLPKLEIVKFFTFGNCYRVNTIELNNAEKIENAAFKECCYLKHLDISNAEVFTGDDFGAENYMFYRCNNINEIYLPKLQGKIPDNCFRGCRSMKMLYMPYVDYIGNNALDLCYNLEMLYIPNVKEIASTLFIINGTMFAPNLEETVYFPYSDNVEIYLSDKFRAYEGNSEVSFDYKIIAPINSYAYKLANENSWSFIASDNREVGQTDTININDKGRSICTSVAGLRFGFTWDNIDEIEDLATDIEYGFIYSQKGSEDLTIDTVDGKTVKKTVANNRIEHGDTTSFNLVISNIPKVYYDRVITARAYVCIDGMYFYSNILNGSFNEVAGLVLADNEIDQNTKNAVNKLLEA